MPAYNFKNQFADKVEKGEKRQTIRFPRKRQTIPGDTLHLYTGMRTKSCRRLLPPTPCTAVKPVEIIPQGVILDGEPLWGDDLDKFAIADGFNDFGELSSFLHKAYPNQTLKMEVIYW